MKRLNKRQMVGFVMMTPLIVALTVYGLPALVNFLFIISNADIAALKVFSILLSFVLGLFIFADGLSYK